MTLEQLRRRVKWLEKLLHKPPDFGQYVRDPRRYCREILRVHLTPTQERIAQLLVEPPYQVMVRAGHNVGKSFLAACLVNWWFDCFRPGICLTTAPTDRQVRDILWREVRVLRGARGGFPGPKMCRLESGPDHWAHGFTARDGSRFQGHHNKAVLIIFDEATGVDAIFWEAAESMLGGAHYGFLAIYNPLDQGSPAYAAERKPHSRVVSMSALDHPNIAAEVAGCKPPYPSAIRLGRLRELMAQWSVPVVEEQPAPTDVWFDGRWWRPGPVAEARLLGRWPTRAVNAVWSEWAWQKAETTILPDTGPLQIGCDVARYGDDFTAIHIRKGGVSLYHEAVNGWSVVQTVERLKALAVAWGQRYQIDPQRVPVAIDDAGVGGGVTDLGRAGGWNFIPVLGAAAALQPDEYPNLRSALWFGVVEEAVRGNLSVARLPASVRADLRRELLAPTYILDARGRRVVESKDQTKSRLQRSPDNADALHLAYVRLQDGPERVLGRLRVPE